MRLYAVRDVPRARRRPRLVGMDPSMSQEILSLAEIPCELAMEAPDLRFQGLRAPVPSSHGTGFSGVGNLILHARMKKAALPTGNEGRHGDADTGLAGRFQSANRARPAATAHILVNR